MHWKFVILYVTYCLFKDAYIGMDKSKNLSVGIAFFVGSCNVIPSFIEYDKMYVNGIFQASFGQFILGLTFIYIGIILIVKKLMDKKA